MPLSPLSFCSPPARSPVFSHVSATLRGLQTIRAYRVERAFEAEFDSHQNLHTEAWFLFITTSRWLAIRLDILCAAFITAVAICSVAASQSESSIVHFSIILYIIFYFRLSSFISILLFLFIYFYLLFIIIIMRISILFLVTFNICIYSFMYKLYCLVFLVFMSQLLCLFM